MAATKGNEKIAEWSDAIINHFWYCCSVASECNDKVNATAVLKVMLSTITKAKLLRLSGAVVKLVQAVVVDFVCCLHSR